MRTTFLFFLAALLLFACKGNREAPKPPAAALPTPVDVIVAGMKQMGSTVETNGSVIASESVQIFPEVSGRLTQLNVPDGGSVRAGTLLAKINDAELQAQLSKSQVQLDLAQKTEERLKKLLAVSGVNQAEYDTALNAVNNIKADINLLKAQIEKTEVRAPFDGVLGLRQVSPGAYVSPQTVLATLQQVAQVKIDFTLPEGRASLVRKGQKVTVVADEKGEKRTATVLATESEINATTRNLKVRAILNGKPVAPGSFVKVFLEAGAARNFIVIPTNAIIPDAESKKVVVVKGGKGKFVPIETGVRSAGGVEVLSGLAVGDSVVVTGVLFVRPNAPLRIGTVKTLEESTKEAQ